MTKLSKLRTAFALVCGVAVGTPPASLLASPEPIEKNTSLENITRAQKAENDQAKLSLPPLIIQGGKIYYKQWTVPNEVFTAAAETYLKSPIPFSLLLEIAKIESSFNTQAYNRSSGACGLGQFIPSTLYQMAYEHGGDVGFPEAHEMIEKYISKRDRNGNPYYRYKPVNAEAKKNIKELCFNPHFNIRLQTLYLLQNTARMQEDLKEFAPKKSDYYPILPKHVYLAHFSGRGAATQMIRHIEEAKQTGKAGKKKYAHQYFSRRAKRIAANRALLYDGKKPRTVEEFIDFLEEKKGLVGQPLADMRNWKKQIHFHIPTSPLRIANSFATDPAP